jgi:hypothetical protein
MVFQMGCLDVGSLAGIFRGSHYSMAGIFPGSHYSKLRFGAFGNWPLAQGVTRDFSPQTRSGRQKDRHPGGKTGGGSVGRLNRPLACLTSTLPDDPTGRR